MRCFHNPCSSAVPFYLKGRNNLKRLLTYRQSQLTLTPPRGRGFTRKNQRWIYEHESEFYRRSACRFYCLRKLSLFSPRILFSYILSQRDNILHQLQHRLVYKASFKTMISCQEGNIISDNIGGGRTFDALHHIKCYTITYRK